MNSTFIKDRNIGLWARTDVFNEQQEHFLVLFFPAQPDAILDLTFEICK